jgi:hypothetical protein
MERFKCFSAVNTQYSPSAGAVARKRNTRQNEIPPRALQLKRAAEYIDVSEMSMRRLIARAAATAAVATTAAVTSAAVAANNAAATSNAYNAGYNAGANTSTDSSSTNKQTTTSTTTVVAPNYTVGQIAATLPAGCITPTVQGTTYYLCGNTWFSAAYGANGVYYRVVTAP